MVIVQVVITAPGHDLNNIEVNILEREDANDQEREVARAIQDMHQAAFQAIAEQMPEGEFRLTVIEKDA